MKSNTYAYLKGLNCLTRFLGGDIIFIEVIEMKKLSYVLSLILCIAVLPFVFSGCSILGNSSSSSAVSIDRIAKTDSDGLVDTYTIYLSDGTTSQYEVINGSNGAKGERGNDGQADIKEIWKK